MQRIVAIFLVMNAFFACGQSFTTINYSVTEGLPSSEVYEVYEDRQGFLWFATDNGVAKFDGKEMEVFNAKDGLTDPVVFNMQEDHRGRIWFRTYSGKLCYYENGKITGYRYNDTLSDIAANGLMNFVYLTSSDELWFSVRNVFGKIDSTGAVSSRKMVERGIFLKTLEDRILVWSWSQGHRSLQHLYLNDRPFEITLSDTTQTSAPSVVRLNDKLYIGFYNALFEATASQVKKVFDAANPIISVSKDKTDNLWVGFLNGGVKRFRPGDLKNAWEPLFLKGKSVTKVLQDREGGLWFTTLENGVFHIPNLFIENYIVPKANKPRAIVSVGDSVFVGDQNGNLTIFSARNKKVIEEESFSSSVLSLFVDSKKQVWLSNRNDIFLYGSKRLALKNFNAVDLDEDPEGFVWMVSGNRIGKFTLRGEQLLFQGFPFIHRTITVDDSLLYISNRTGWQVRKKTLELVNVPNNFAEFKISNIEKINDTTLLISTIGRGFLLVNNETWNYSLYDATHNFIADNIYTTLKNDSSLWLGTEKGVAIVNLRSLLMNNPRFEYLTKYSGLIDDKINFLTRGYHSTWAFSDQGFSVIPDGMISFASKKPIFHLKGILVNNKTMERSDEIDLDHTQNNIRITFGYLSFNNQNVFTRYRMSAEDSWSYTSDRMLQFNSLSPRAYTLELEASSDNIHWTPVYISPRIVIHPPVWQTWYFQIGVGSVIIILVLLYFQNQVRVYRKHQQKLIQSELQAIEQERSRIAKDLHDSVGTDFTAIKMTVSQTLKKHNEPKTDEIETQFQSTIQEIKNIIYGLAPPGLERYGLIAGLDNYIRKLNGNIPLQLEMKAYGEEIKNPKLNIAVFRILQELISNSLKHSNGKIITIHVNSFEDLLNIVYEDDGKGFSWSENQRGLGLYNIESRIQSVNGKLKFDSGDFGVSYSIDIPLNDHSKLS